MFHQPAPAPATTLSQPPPAQAQQWREVEPEVRSAPQTAAPARAASEGRQPTPAPTASETSPRPTVTSTMTAGSRQEAEAAINEVDKRLALASSADPAGTQSEKISVVRKLRDGAQQALDQQDYLTAQSLAQKASILAAQLPGASTPQALPSK